MKAIIFARRGIRPVLTALLIGVIGLTLFFSGGFRLGRLALFQIRKPHYEQLLSESIRTGEIPNGEGHVDEGPPIRFAFYWVRGVTDNWAGVVHDPTGKVMEVNQANGWSDLDDPRWSDSVMLFGGTLYKCERLQGDWYLCWFT